MSAYTAEAYRQPLFRPADDLFGRCLTGSFVLGLLFLIAVFVVPVRQIAAPHVTKLPKRLARLILEKPKPLAPAEQAVPEAKPIEEIAEPLPAEPETPRQRRDEPRVDPNAGQLGRERAQKTISKELQSTSAALQSSLQDLSSSLRSTQSETDQPARARRSRSVRAGRSSDQLDRVETNLSGGSADLAGSVVSGSNVVVGTLTAGGSDGGAASPSEAGASGGSGSPPGVYRSNASLLAVIQKYSAGIQYCYANELKRNESLRGKLVVAITVAPSGEVTDAAVVENTLGSQRLADCALSQIREWKFPPAQGGMTTFQAPFVFTPPK